MMSTIVILIVLNNCENIIISQKIYNIMKHVTRKSENLPRNKTYNFVFIVVRDRGMIYNI